MSNHRNSFAKGALAAPSESFKRRNPHLFLPPSPKLAAQVTAASLIAEASPRERRLRQDQGPKLNKLETQFLRVLQVEYPTVRIRSQDRRYELGRGIWFKPDFTAMLDGQETAWETKGPHAFRGGLENLKVAARVWPEVNWFLVWRDKETGQWKRQKVQS